VAVASVPCVPALFPNLPPGRYAHAIPSRAVRVLEELTGMSGRLPGNFALLAVLIPFLAIHLRGRPPLRLAKVPAIGALA
jgi:hypothetical protein